MSEYTQDPAATKCLPSVISEPRLRPYLRHYHGNQTYALRLYMWNVSLSSAFWGPISILEVALRNRIRAQLNTAGITVRGELLQSILCERERSKFLKDTGKLGDGVSEDDAVAVLSLGFWTGLFSSGIWRHRQHDYVARLWHRARLKDVFPNREHTGNDHPSRIYGDLESLRKFRNRIAHHEPIWKRDVYQHLNRLERIAMWMDLELAAYIETNQRISEVLEQKQDAITRGHCPL